MQQTRSLLLREGQQSEGILVMARGVGTTSLVAAAVEFLQGRPN